MGDMGDFYRDWKDHRRGLRATYGVECPTCKVKRPKTNASILLPGQRCKVDGYRDTRPRLSNEEMSSVESVQRPTEPSRLEDAAKNLATVFRVRSMPKRGKYNAARNEARMRKRD